MDDRLINVLRAEAAGVDLAEDAQGNITVWEQRADGKVRQIGMVSSTLVHQDPQAAHSAISRIKFGGWNHK